METIRDIKELLAIMLSNAEHFDTGLCRLSGDLRHFGIINKTEEALIDDYVLMNTRIRVDTDGYSSNYRFPYGEWLPRKKWLEKEISKL